ncbi:MAG: hypothetical protein JJT94_01190, partial [Bernardetiaceae bacterium]|nr:hypothetical protein [Bernardetiaceae bacterium]
PQVRKEARVGSCSGAMSATIFYLVLLFSSRSPSHYFIRTSSSCFFAIPYFRLFFCIVFFIFAFVYFYACIT